MTILIAANNVTIPIVARGKFIFNMPSSPHATATLPFYIPVVESPPYTRQIIKVAG